MPLEAFGRTSSTTTTMASGWFLVAIAQDFNEHSDPRSPLRSLSPALTGTIPGAMGDILAHVSALTSNLAVIFTLNQNKRRASPKAELQSNTATQPAPKRTWSFRPS